MRLTPRAQESTINELAAHDVGRPSIAQTSTESAVVLAAGSGDLNPLRNYIRRRLLLSGAHNSYMDELCRILASCSPKLDTYARYRDCVELIRACNKACAKQQATPVKPATTPRPTLGNIGIDGLATSESRPASAVKEKSAGTRTADFRKTSENYQAGPSECRPHFEGHRARKPKSIYGRSGRGKALAKENEIDKKIHEKFNRDMEEFCRSAFRRLAPGPNSRTDDFANQTPNGRSMASRMSCHNEVEEVDESLLDAKHHWGSSFRDHGQFGSYPSHDDMGED
ncbi:hypothetical protein [Azohydromonas australica]|uniref:hypothetical protein n=1 Tax=Azohydromonas australica TaxID=364039 RepID=UPI0012EB2272|nr:hypothetical protein [Azohydromonas australica]